MKFAIVVVVALIVIAGGIALAKNGKSNGEAKPSTATAQTQTQSLTIKTVQSDVAKGGRLIDVRTTEEYAASHIDGAINLSLQDIQQNKLPDAAKDAPIYLYCRSGNRSGQAAKILKDAGYTKVTDLGAMTYVQSIGGSLKS